MRRELEQNNSYHYQLAHISINQHTVNSATVAYSHTMYTMSEFSF